MVIKKLLQLIFILFMSQSVIAGMSMYKQLDNNFYLKELAIDTSLSISTNKSQKRFFNSFREMPNYKGKQLYISAVILGSAGVFLNVANIITNKRVFKIVGYPAMLVGFVVLVPAGILEHKRTKSFNKL
jgi:hypothetical protein